MLLANLRFVFTHASSDCLTVNQDSKYPGTQISDTTKETDEYIHMGEMRGWGALSGHSVL